VLDALVGRGHKVGATQKLGQVNAIWCPGGLPRAPESCAVEVDPRGFGLAVSADQ
jgi:gamma-glutamyltranspeptidase/glutathione hydrolase